MLRRFQRLLLLVLAWLVPLAALAGPVVVAEIRGAISPASADYFLRALAEAERQTAALLVLRLDTPGGLDTAMRRMIQGILGARVPVAVHVAPSGARAASAGTYILYASHVAAMAPGTNLGAATPVPVGIGGGDPARPPAAPDPEEDKGAGGGGKKPEQEKPKAEKAEEGAPERGRRPGAGDPRSAKAVHDAAAYLRSLAQLRGRNVQWAERAVREAVSLSADEALEQKVIDLVAADLQDLLRQSDGRTIQVGTLRQRLAVADAAIVAIEPNWKERLLTVIADPNIALLLMMIGVYGLIFEFYSPGLLAPGVIGGISLLLGLYGLALLPINFVGVALLVLGIGLMAAEAFIPSFGVLGIGGIAAFVAGAFMLTDGTVPGLTVSWQLVAPLAIVSAMVLAGIGTYAVRARRRPAASGAAAMLGGTVRALEDIADEGWVEYGGERWRARARQPLALGERARIVALEGLTLIIQTDQKGEKP